jgi:hypothetical protein
MKKKAKQKMNIIKACTVAARYCSNNASDVGAAGGLR